MCRHARSWINTCCLDGWCANIGNVTADEKCECPLSESKGEMKSIEVNSAPLGTGSGVRRKKEEYEILLVPAWFVDVA